jgi:putative two-component system response regulator
MGTPSPDGNCDARVIVVDDDERVLAVVERSLRSRNYDVSTAPSGPAALDALAGQRFDVMICDVRMPGMSGLDLLERASRIDGDLAILLLTGLNDARTATQALKNGAAGYLMKPIAVGHLCHAVAAAIAKRAAAMHQRRHEQLIREEVAHYANQLERDRATLSGLTVKIAETLVNALESKDGYLRGNSQRVAHVAAAVADHLGLEPDMVEAVRIAGRLHDIGRIGTRESVLNKPGLLTEDEFRHVKEHVAAGVEILAPLTHLAQVRAFVQDHHEHWDGSGYPRGLRGEEISLGGRILAAADAYVALTSRRAYREPVSGVEAIALLQRRVGSVFDPRVHDALRSVITDDGSVLEFLDDSAPGSEWRPPVA